MSGDDADSPYDFNYQKLIIKHIEISVHDSVKVHQVSFSTDGAPETSQNSCLSFIKQNVII